MGWIHRKPTTNFGPICPVLVFFMRHEIKADSLPFDLEGLRTALRPIANEFEMDLACPKRFAVRKKVVLMASREFRIAWLTLFAAAGTVVSWSAIFNQWLFPNHDDLAQYGRSGTAFLFSICSR